MAVVSQEMTFKNAHRSKLSARSTIIEIGGFLTGFVYVKYRGNLQSATIADYILNTCIVGRIL